ncbi:MAG: hypothetical protein AB8F34_03095 [Akkermansiaceae bacterium]
MIHLPKKRPWLILVGIYAVIMMVWAGFYFLAKETGDQQVDPEEAAQLLEKRETNNDAK